MSHLRATLRGVVNVATGKRRLMSIETGLVIEGEAITFLIRAADTRSAGYSVALSKDVSRQLVTHLKAYASLDAEPAKGGGI